MFFLLFTGSEENGTFRIYISLTQNLLLTNSSLGPKLGSRHYKTDLWKTAQRIGTTYTHISFSLTQDPTYHFSRREYGLNLLLYTYSQNLKTQL